MTPEEKQLLEQKKKQLQRKNRATEFAEEAIKPCLEIMDALTQAEISYDVAAVVCIAAEHQPFLEQLLHKEPFVAYRLFDVPKMENNPMLESLMEHYPNTHPFRYVPDLPKYDFWWHVKEQIKKHQLEDQEVYLCYLQYALVFKVKMSEWTAKATEEIFNTWYGDMVVFPADYHWLLVHSINDFWQFGNKPIFNTLT